MNQPNNIERLYHDSWSRALSAGKEQLGNLEINLKFLDKANIFKQDDRIHELGCGIGTIVNHLKNKGYRVSGSDIAPNAINYGKNKFHDIELVVHSAENLPYDDRSFDVILSFDVLEHLFEVDKHLLEIYRALKDGGHYVFQTPNKYISAIYDTLRRRDLKWRIHHPSLYAPGQLKKRLEKCGFSVMFYKMNPTSNFLVKKLGRWAFLGSIISIIPFQYMPLFFQTNLYVVAKKI